VIGSDGSHLPLYDSDRLNFGSQNEASLLFLPLALLVLIAHVILGLQLASFVRTIFMKHKPIPEEVCAEFYSWRSHSQTVIFGIKSMGVVGEKYPCSRARNTQTETCVHVHLISVRLIKVEI